MPFQLDFAIIGVQKGGTTTLWDHLRGHPDIWMPLRKELDFFSETPIYEQGVERWVAMFGEPVPSDRLHGTATPRYMHGWHDATTAVVAERIARTFPDIKLVALLRDPVERAASAHAMSVSRDRDRRSFGEAIEALLTEQGLAEGRSWPTDVNTYVVQGEYGRILSEYLELFPRSALHLDLTSELERDAAGCLARVLGFLGVAADYRPPDIELRLFRGGSKPRLAPDALAELERGLVARLRRGAPSAELDAWIVERARGHGLSAAAAGELGAFLRRNLHGVGEPASEGDLAGVRFLLRKVWNVEPEPHEALDPELERALRAHYAEDGELLRRVAEIDVPWRRGATVT